MPQASEPRGLEQVLELLLITYNRAAHLDRTLRQLAQGPFAGCRLTVLDNASTDATPEVCARYADAFADLRVVRHARNLGAGPNYLRAVELSESEFTWVLCDDDAYDFSDCDDVIDAVLAGEHDLISVGAPGQEPWERGLSATTQELVRRGSRYLFVSTFIPNTIFRTSLFGSHALAQGYRNVDNLYPHFEFFVQCLRDDRSVYGSRRELIRRVGFDNTPSPLYWLAGWARSCARIPERGLRRWAVAETAPSGREWLQTHVFAVAAEKAANPERIGRSLNAMALAYSPRQRAGLALASLPALVPGALLRAARDTIARVRRAPAEAPALSEFDELRL